MSYSRAKTEVTLFIVNLPYKRGQGFHVPTHKHRQHTSTGQYRQRAHNCVPNKSHRLYIIDLLSSKTKCDEQTVGISPDQTWNTLQSNFTLLLHLNPAVYQYKFNYTPCTLLFTLWNQHIIDTHWGSSNLLTSALLHSNGLSFPSSAQHPPRTCQDLRSNLEHQMRTAARRRMPPSPHIQKDFDMLLLFG